MLCWNSILIVLNDDNNNNVLNINSFQDCQNLNTLHYKDSNRIQYLAWTIIAVYVTSDLLYSIVVLRLFVSNVLKLAVFTSEIDPKKHTKPKLKVLFF